MNLIGSPIVFYSLIKHDRARLALKRKNCFRLLALKYILKLKVLDYNPLEFLLKQSDDSPSFSMSE